MAAPMLPPPNILGAPQQFTQWRHSQDLAVLRCLSTPKRFPAHAVPTGGGKSLIYMMAALLQEPGKRAVILTATKGLADQLSVEFGDIVADIRGIANYRCQMEHDFPGKYEAFKIAEHREPNCDEGPCHFGRKCSLLENGCHYYDALRKARKARIVLTNYSYWMAISNYSSEGLGDFDFLVLDEAHEAPEELSKFLRVELGPWESEPHGLGFPRSNDVAIWTKWSTSGAERVGNLVSKLRAENPGAHAEIRKLEELRSKLSRLSSMDSAWIGEKTGDYGAVKWEPKWPAKHAEGCLFMGIKTVAFFSATMIPKTLNLVGVKDEEMDFHYYPSPYPGGRRPFIHVPNIQLNRYTTIGQLYIWLALIDRLIEARLDKKGIIHTISYDRMRFVIENSRWAPYMIYNDPRSGQEELKTQAVVERFKKTQGFCIFVSPSVGTGYDFPGTQCEWQIIGKLPYPDTRSAVMAARVEEDKEYGNYLTAVTLVQTSGRGMRGPQDICETLMVDDSIRWFYKRNSHLLPLWFRDTMRWADEGVLPTPLPKLVA
jgi:ATP-dependent DNA helicase DinG